MSGPVSLFEFVCDRIHDSARHNFEAAPDAAFCGVDRWVLASLLQKGIRRGDVRLARRAGVQLLAADPSRLWRRLMTAGLEDIGIGEPETAAIVIGIATLPQVRHLLGGNVRALDVALLKACEAVKDRNGDHFGSLARTLNAVDSHGLDLASRNALGAVLASPHVSWRRRLRAAIMLSDWSEDLASSRMEKFGFAAEIFAALEVPAGLIAASSSYVARARDCLPVFVPFAWCLWRAGGSEIATTRHALPQTDWIGELPGYAFDPLHTRVGRRAVDLWLRSYLQRPKFEARQIAIALWNLESAACARTLCWQQGQAFQDEAEGADLRARALPHSLHSEIRAFILQEAKVLSCARRAAWEGVLRERVTGDPQLVLEPPA